MTTLHEAAQKAIYWLDQNGGAHIADELREALAQQGEPVEYQSFTKPGFMSPSPTSWEPCTPEQYHEYLKEGTPVRALYVGAAPAAQPETWIDDGGWEFPIERPVRAYQEDYQCAEQQGEPAAWVFKNEYGITLSEGDCTALPDGVSTPLYAVAAPAAQPQCETARVLEWMRTPNRKAAQLAFTEGPERQAAYWIEIAQGEQAPQPTCKQDLQVPTVKENLTVETEQERYVRMCPDIECGRKKRCTRMVGVSCMSRADIAPAAQPLSIEEVEQINAQWNYETHGDRTRYIARMVERAHGIGVQK